MKIVVITQNGAPYLAFTDYDQACNKYHMLETEFPWFQWQVIHMSVDTTEAKIKSVA